LKDSPSPCYSPASIVNASNATPGPFAPNSVISIYGTSLSYFTQALTDSNLKPCGTSLLPARCFDLSQDLNGVKVYVQNQPVPVLFVSPTQVNFLMSSVERPGPVTVRVVNNGKSGPDSTVTLVDAAPALFSMAGGYVIAQDVKFNLLTADAPAHAGDTVVVYLTGLGQTSPNPAVGEIPNYAATMLAFASLKVTLNGTAVDREMIKYAGLTPGCGGLYQINLLLPKGTGDDPEIQVTAGNLAAQTGLKLPLR